jgi:hypothetical protein
MERLWKALHNHSYDKPKTMTLSAEEFIRRVLLHVLPSGFQRIRYFGFLGNRYRHAKLALCRRLLGMALSLVVTTLCGADYRDHYEQLTGNSLRTCPVCAQGQMRYVETLAAGDFDRARILDSS